MKLLLSCQKINLRYLMRWVGVLAISILAISFLNVATAQTSGATGISFNHNVTGFVLDGAHVKLNCESCHTQGMFRGTPRDCATCHRPGDRAPGKTLSHIPTLATCDTCHRNTSWTPSNFQHRIDQGVIPGTCNTCHNGSNTTGKPSTHLATTASCDSCHKTSAWMPAGYDHAAVVPGTCATCHNGARATGKPTSHIPTTAACDSCHAAGVAFAPVSVSISGIHAKMTGPAAAGNCATCHSGSFLTQNAQAKPATHVPTTSQCDACHNSTSSWATVTKPDHPAITPSVNGRCSDCHNGVAALAKPTNHIPTAKQCDSCHLNFSAFKPSQMNHIGTTAQCSSCHNGSFNFANAQSKPNLHIPTTAQCDSCHVSGFVAWAPATMNHAGMSGKCATCHSGTFISQNAQTKPATHISTTAQCDSCHSSTTSWATASFNHASATPAVTGRCSSCHNSVNALGKPVAHIPTTAQCDTCHINTVSFKPAQMNHVGMSGQCASCHNGSYVFVNAASKPANHIPTAAQCDTCHASGFVLWSPATMNHTGMKGQCSTCHSGSYVSQNAQTKTPTHIPTAAQCDTCHSSTVSWATATFVHDAGTNGTCSTCHNGVAALGKPTNHLPSSMQCDTCHTGFSAFKPAKMSHVGTTAQCSTCHSGSFTSINALAKPVNHIPTIAQCDTCHKNGFISWSPSVMNHAGLAGQCSTCHSGAYLVQNAQAKPATHIATTAQCDTCHNSTLSWATATFNHATATPPATGRCSSCHNGTTALGRPSNHIPTTAQCDTCHNGFVAFAPGVMNHTGTTGPAAAGNCATCHSGAYIAVNAQVKNAAHIPTTQSCDTCHTSVAWKPTSYTHQGVVAGACASCHNGTSALGKATNHLPTAASCDVCHNNFNTFAPAKMNHAGSTGPLAAGSCSSCHSGTYLAINAQVKPATHVATTAQCDACHSSTVTWATATFAHDASANGTCSTCHNGATALGKPTNHIPTSVQCDTCHSGFSAFKPARMIHTGTTAQCSTCHSGSFASINALAKPANHIPTIAQCDTCHTKGFVNWSPSVMSHIGLAGQCSTCHSGAYLAQNAHAKPATHIATTAQCDTCHNSTVSWATASFNHATATPPVAGRCSTCHNGSTALGRPSNHIPTTAQCDTCHAGFVAFAPGAMSHTATTGPVAANNCSTCHSGAYVAINAQAKSATHVATTAQCDTCHKSTITWAGASFSHDLTAIGKCSTCHNGVTALGKNATHIPTSTQCDACHTGYLAFKPAKMSHTGLTGQCSTCHSGSYTSVNALGKPAVHIPTAAQCDVCHVSGFLSFAPSTMSHAGTTSPLAVANCSTCHSGTYVAQNAQAKSATHVVTTAQCDTCHNSTVSWATATFNHATASPAVAGRCATCHNGITALGKPTNHLPTSAQCDTCHTGFVAFAPGVMSHTGTTGPVASGNCATCHSGAYISINAKAKPATHIPTTQSCDTCHTTAAWKPTSYGHQGVIAGTCASCHNGTAALGKAASHLPTTASCDACHNNYNAFAPAKMNHAGSKGPLATGNCSTCHSGAYLAINAQVKPATHVTTTAQCDSCHSSTVSWATATYTHDAAAIGKCSTCHNGATALGKPTTHIPTTAQCSTCHNNYNSFRPAIMSHAGTTGPSSVANCSTCHAGAYVAVNALAKPATHIPTASQCDTCHTKGYVTWSPSVMSHAGLAGQCSTCHSGAYVSQNAQTKPATHVLTTAQCDTCHNSTITWATATFNHATATPAVAGRCATCHNGTNALGKPTSHIPTAAQCDKCHTGFVAFAPGLMNHTATIGPVAAGNCISCHNGAYVAVNAQAKNATHISTSLSCDACHTTLAWKPTSFTHAGVVAGTCATCHNGTNASGKSTPHIPTTQSCDVCHRTGLSWLPLITPYAHTGVPTTGCVTCHTSSYPNIDVKPANHLPTTSSCESCHHSFASWLPTTFNHTGVVTGTCQTCHGGTYPNITTKPSNHIPTTTPAGMPGNECSLCHSSKTSFGVEKMNHGTMMTGCITCHDSTANYLGSMKKEKRTTNHHGVNAVGKDCSSSGCHKPLGSKGSTYNKWD